MQRIAKNLLKPFKIVSKYYIFAYLKKLHQFCRFQWRRESQKNGTLEKKKSKDLV